ncbi:MAG: 2'-5' RNA ligase family protein, partial [Bacteroidota bacterium]
RLFLGIPLSAETQAHLAALHVRYAPNDNWKWVSPELYHITLYFFGEVPVERMPNMIALLQVALKDRILPPFVFDRYMYAPAGKEPRMLWARYRKQEAFKSLIQKLHELYQKSIQKSKFERVLFPMSP